MSKYSVSLFNKAANKLLNDHTFQFLDTIYFHIGASNLRSQLAIGKIGVGKMKEMEVVNNNGQPPLHFEYALRRTDML